MSSGTLTRQLNETEQAFAAVVSVGRERADMIEQAQREGDIAAESMAIVFGIAALHEAIEANPKAKEIIGRAAGHKWGFSTDQNKPNGGGSTYSSDIVIPCFCEALLQKLKPVGNEFNIIKGSTYVTKEGWTGKLMRLPGVTEVDIAPGVIRPEDCVELRFKTNAGKEKTEFSVYASARASCRVWGHLVEVTAGVGTNGIDERLQVAADGETMSDVIDQLRGKAIARIAHRLFQKCVNLSMSGGQATTAEKTHAELRRIEVAAKTIERVKRFDPSTVVEQRDTQTIADQPIQKQALEIVTVSKDEMEAMTSQHKLAGVAVVNSLEDDTINAKKYGDLWDSVGNAKTATNLKAEGKAIKDAGDHFTDSQLEPLRQWYTFRMNHAIQNRGVLK